MKDLPEYLTVAQIDDKTETCTTCGAEMLYLDDDTECAFCADIREYRSRKEEL